MRIWTREKDNFPCRIANGCNAEEWFDNHVKGMIVGNICDDCPFENLINALAEHEDKEEGKDNE